MKSVISSILTKEFPKEVTQKVLPQEEKLKYRDHVNLVFYFSMQKHALFWPRDMFYIPFWPRQPTLQNTPKLWANRVGGVSNGI